MTFIERELRNLSVGDVARLLGQTTRITGTPEQIADRLEEWAAAGVDGVNVMYSTTPGTFEDFIAYVAPELQRRGLMQREYRPRTFREKLFGAGPYLPERHVGRSYRYKVPPKDGGNQSGTGRRRKG